MSFLLWIGVVIYTAVGLAVDRMAAGHVAFQDAYHAEPDTGDWVWGFLIGTIAGAIWPLIVALWVVGRGFAAFRRHPRLTFLAVGAEAKALRKKQDLEEAQRQREIAQLERDLLGLITELEPEVSSGDTPLQQIRALKSHMDKQLVELERIKAQQLV